jgi:hypothetical protein
MTDLRTTITNELAGDIASLARSYTGGLDLESAKALITAAFLADLQDGDNKAHVSTQTKLFSKGDQYNAIGLMLIPVADEANMVTSLQTLRKKSYHTYHYSCFTDSGWQYRAKGYGAFGVTAAREMTTAKPVTGGIVYRPGDAGIFSTYVATGTLKDGCTADLLASSAKTYTIWNMSNDSVDIAGVAYKILIGVTSGDNVYGADEAKMMDSFLGEAWDHR